MAEGLKLEAQHTTEKLLKASAADLVRMTVPRPVRNWLRSPSKSAQWLWDAARFYAGRTKTLSLDPNLTILCHPQAYRAAFEAQVIDSKQREEFEHFLTLCSPEMRLFDIGAHFGVFSIAAALKGGRAIAVDPSPVAVRMIARQASLNRCSGNIQIVCSAASDSNGVLGLLSSGVFSHGYFKVAGGRSSRELTEVPSVTMDELVRRFGVPTHIKIDVEGHEAAVLRGSRGVLAKHSPTLLLELHNEIVHSEGGDPAAAVDEIVRLGYRLLSPSGRLLSRNEILSESIIRIVATRGLGGMNQ